MRRLHPASAVLRALSTGASVGTMGGFGGFAVAAVFELEPPLLYAVLFGLLGLVAGAAIGLAQYYRFSYDVSGGTLSIGSGVIDRQERDIPLGRIQNVDIRRNLLNRILGIAVVRFETAGGASTEGVLNAVSIREARRLQDAVANRREEGEEVQSREPAVRAPDVEPAVQAPDDQPAVRAPDVEAASPAADVATEPTEGDELTKAATEQPPRGEERRLFELSTSDLFVLSMVSFRPAAPALVIFGLPILGDIALDLFARSLVVLGAPPVQSIADIFQLPPPEALIVIFIGGVQVLLVTWVTSALLTANEYYDFELTHVGDDLRYERGFLQRYSGTIPLGKVQTVTIKENVLMRRFGYGALALETAGYGPGQSGSSGANTAVPLDDREVVLAMAEDLGDVSHPDVERPPGRARRRYAVRFGLVGIAFATLAFAIDALVFEHPWWLVLLGLALAPIAGHYRWKHRGHETTEPAFVARQGFWRRHTRIVPYYRIQTVIDSRTVFQRWRNLATVTADTASTASLVGGDATAHDIEEADARDLHATLRERLAADRLQVLREGRVGGERGTPHDAHDDLDDEQPTG